MNIPEKIALFVFLAALLCAAPGSTMLFTISQGLTRNKFRVICGIWGTVSANFVWVLCSALGIGAIIRDSQTLFLALKYIGAAYLLYLGISTMIKAKTEKFDLSVGRTPTYASVYLQGFLTTMTNPKALLCYLSFLPQFVSGKLSYGLETFYWGMGYIGVIVVVMGSYAILANKLSQIIKNHKVQIRSKRAVGLGFIAASFSMLKS